MKRLVLLTAALSALLALPAMAGATVSFTKASKAPNAAILVADDDGTNVRSLGVSGIEPVISPNGQWVAYNVVTDTKTWTLATRMVNVATGAVVDPGASCGGPVWAPNSSAILCSITSSTAKGDVTGSGIASVTTAGVVQTVVAPLGVLAGGFGWSPDSTKIVYSTQKYPGKIVGGTITIANPDGSNAVGITAGYAPVWGPTAIAFARAKVLSGRFVRSQIWTVDPAVGASSATQLTSFASKNRFITGPSPAFWTADGSTIVGNLNGEDYIQPFYVRVATKKTKLFGPSNAMAVAVSADGTQALVSANLLGGGKQTAYASPLSASASSLLLKNADNLTATANWQP